MAGIASDWTTEVEQPPRECSKCRTMVPFDIWVRNVNVNNRNPNAPPRHHCQACFEYYSNKPGTTVFTDTVKNSQSRDVRGGDQGVPAAQAAPIPASSSNAIVHQNAFYGAVNAEVIYRNNLAAQRPDLGQYRAVPVHALPPSITASKHNQPGLPYNPLAVMAPPSFQPGMGGWIASQRPVQPLGYFPPQVASSVPPYGYGPQHHHYGHEVAKYARLQKEGQSFEFRATLQVVYELEHAEVKGKKFKRYEPLSNLADTIPVTPHTTAIEIVATSRNAANKLVLARHEDFHFYDFNLKAAAVRDPNSWADLEQLNSFGEGFFFQQVMVPVTAAKGKAANFNAKPALQFKAPKEPPVILVVVPWRTYNKYLHHVEESELREIQGKKFRGGPSVQRSTPMSESAVDYVPSTGTTSKKRGPGLSTSSDSKRLRHLSNGPTKKSETADRTPTAGQTPPLVSLNREEIAQVLLDGGSGLLDPSKVAAFKAVVEDVLLFKVEDHRLGTIQKLESKSFHAQLQQARGYHATIAVDAHKSQKGAQKTAHACQIISADAETVSELFGGMRKLMAKRPFHQSGPGAIGRLPIAEELPILSTECNTTYYANALMLLTYDFMENVEVRKGQSPLFPIPRVRFVKTALCIVLSPHGSKEAVNNMVAGLKISRAISPSIRLSYMVEERIMDKFVKYIHNGEPVPFVLPDHPSYELAEFLCFTQHVQYGETGHLAFLSDYQGGGDLLTDPQIMTSDFGKKHLFGTGNIVEGFEEFEEKHRCNKYCKWYELDEFNAGEQSFKVEGGKKAQDGAK